ncbi:MAG TPA: tryptophan 7-halogenase [Trichormus sp. M33_DOE_039]|nr:tryptophan 7-halogenase [Trichormus sp. M33_DOE_039]
MNANMYDVAICGGGLAGLTLARQLRQTMPNLSIIVLDRLSRPLPEATFKVGESTVEVGAHYLGEVLQLTDYFEKNHLPKLGLRYFFGDTTGPIENRPELGLSRFHSPSSYQIDRGRLENDLRQFNIEAGINLVENCLVQEIEIAEQSIQLHNIIYTQGADKQTHTIQARWVIDAMGRRRFIQKKLGLGKPNNSRYSAVWFWFDGRLDISNFVDRSVTEWHDRVPNDQRYYSTNHLCGKGYWVWLIPLSSNNTSIGIVTDEESQPFGEHHTYEQAFQWLEKHEPVLASHLKGYQPEKFMKMPKYSYSSRQVFSSDRWACVGEAGMFPDPFYSPGTDLIGFGNSLVTQMIQADLEGKLTPEMVNDANRFLITYRDGVASNIHAMYSCLHSEVTGAVKVIWDTLAAWSFSAPLMFNSIFLDSEKRAKIRKGSGQFFLLTHRMQQLFKDWAAKSTHIGTFEFIDYLEMPFVSELRSRNLQSNKTEQELIDDHIASIQMFEELAQVIFLLALADTMPEKLNDFPENVWLNAWAISLDPEKWENDGLFRPTSQPRNLHRIKEQFQKVIKFRSQVREMAAV